MELLIKRRPSVLLAEDGIRLCEVTMSFPEARGEEKACARMARFYGRIEEAILSLAKEEILPYARAEYLRDSDPRRRFTHRPYRLLHTATAEGERVVRTLELLHRERTLLRRVYSERMTDGGRMVPEKERKKKRRA